MKKLFLIRHGITEQNEQRRYCGVTDVCLSSHGLRQVKLLDRSLSQEKITSIYTSPLNRCMETAGTIAESHSIKARSLQDLSEIDFGQWEGLTFDEIQTQYPEQIRRWFESPDTFVFPDGESVKGFRNRVLNSLNGILEEDGNMVIVGHGGSLRFIICHLCDLGMNCLHSFELEPASVTVLEHHDESTVIRVLNDTCHLKTERQS